MKILKCTVIALLFLLTQKIYGQTRYNNGCYVQSEGRAYVIINGECRFGLLVCNSSISNNYIVLNRTTTTACTTCGSSPRNGVIADFTVFPCPIDDYIPFFILPIGIFVFIYFRQSYLYPTKL